MKKVMNATMILIMISKISFGQVGKTGYAGFYATKIAQKMHDSLGLTTTQQDQLYNINIQLSEHKMEMRKLYSNQDSLTVHFQAIENQRDIMYHSVLSDKEYQLYLVKKKDLLNINLRHL